VTSPPAKINPASSGSPADYRSTAFTTTSVLITQGKDIGTYAGEPDKLVAELAELAELAEDEAIAAADTLLLSVPNSCPCRRVKPRLVAIPGGSHCGGRSVTQPRGACRCKP
jgi:hypothetical protein